MEINGTFKADFQMDKTNHKEDKKRLDAPKKMCILQTQIVRIYTGKYEEITRLFGQHAASLQAFCKYVKGEF